MHTFFWHKNSKNRHSNFIFGTDNLQWCPVVPTKLQVRECFGYLNIRDVRCVVGVLWVPQKCFSKVGLDLIGPLCESNQKKYIIFCIDYFSKYVEAKAIENKTGVAVATFIYELICRYGVLDITITDQGKYYGTTAYKLHNFHILCGQFID